MHLKYDNITISGGVAVGTTTLMDNLRPYLEPQGWKLTSTGNMVREYMKENIMPSASLVSDDFDRAVEKKAYDILKNKKKWVIEAWLAGFVARDLKKTFRILLTCSHDSLRVDRVVNRDKITMTDAKRFIKKREEDNFRKWKKLYGNYNFFDPKYYTIVIDTYSSGQLETMGKVLDAIGYYKA
ncbi:MAG TPA: cytidylate kinase family protein [Patescibacteria group bacterium]|nr:cytidylate kinase family protein [Patescibacteria group bacterium]